MTVHEIRIDRRKTLLEEPNTGHNRWHPDIPPVVRCRPGDDESPGRRLITRTLQVDIEHPTGQLPDRLAYALDPLAPVEPVAG